MSSLCSAVRAWQCLAWLGRNKKKKLDTRANIAHLAGDCPISLVKQEHWGNQSGIVIWARRAGMTFTA